MQNYKKYPDILTMNGSIILNVQCFQKRKRISHEREMLHTYIHTVKREGYDTDHPSL